MLLLRQSLHSLQLLRREQLLLLLLSLPQPGIVLLLLGQQLSVLCSTVHLALWMNHTVTGTLLLL